MCKDKQLRLLIWFYVSHLVFGCSEETKDNRNKADDIVGDPIVEISEDTFD